MSPVLRLVPALSLAALALACGAPQSPGDSDAAVHGAGPKYGGTLKVHNTLDPYDWDITYTGKAVGNREPRALATNSLLGFRSGPDVEYGDSIIRPELAERWEVSPDAKTFTFNLRKGVKFADLPPVNGREFTSADVRWSFEYLARTGDFKKLPRANTGWMLEGLERVDTPDPYTAVVRFKESFAPFLNYVSHEFVYIAPHEIYDQDGHLKNRVVGTGPFQLDEAASQKGTRWILKKNPTYFEAGKPYLDEVQMLVVPDQSAGMAAFKTGQLDWMLDLTAPEAEEFKPSVPNAMTYEFMQNPVHVYMNNSRPPFDDVRVRKALSLAIDRDEFIKVLAGGKGGWAVAGTVPGVFTQEEIKKMVRNDPTEARKLLAEAGYPNGLTVEFTFPTDRGREQITQMELLQAQLTRAGINAVPKGMPYSQYSPLRKKAEHALQITGKDVTGDVDSYLFAVFHPSSGNNYDRIDDPKLNKLLVGQRQEADPVKRKEIIRQAARYLATECYCGLAVYAGAAVQFWQPQLKNYRPNWQIKGWGIEDSWLDR